MKGRNGFIKLYRKLLNSPIWEYSIATDYPQLIAFWVTLLMMVNYEEKKWYDGHTEVNIPAGSIITSIDKLSESMGMSHQTVRTCIKHLENMNMLTRQATRYYTQLFVVNWGKYQGRDSMPTHEPTSSQHRANNEVTTTKEYKEIEEYKTKTQKIAEILGIPPTKGMETYIYEIYKDYVLGDMTLIMKEWCENNKVKPTSMRWMNWVRRDAKEGKLERRES